jgi:hypothetical protein
MRTMTDSNVGQEYASSVVVTGRVLWNATQTMTTKGPAAPGSRATYDSASTTVKAIRQLGRSLCRSRRCDKGESVRSYAVQMALTIYTTQPPWVERKRQEVVYTLINTRSIFETKADRTQHHDIIDIPISPMHFLKAQNWKGASNLEHERSKGGGTNKAKTSLDGAGSAGGLRKKGRAGAVGGAGGRGAQRVGDSHRAGGHDDARVVGGGAGAGGVSAGGTDGLDGGGVGSNGGRLDDRRRSNGVASRAGLDGVASGAGGGSSVTSRGRAGDGSSRAGSNSAGGDNNGAVLLGDTELGGVLVLAGNVVDQLESVAGAVSLEGGGRGPSEGTRVVDTLSKSLDGDNVGGRSTEEEERDRVGGGWLPGDGEGLASRDNLKSLSVTAVPVVLTTINAYLVQGTSDGVASRLANRGVELRSGNAGEESNDGGLGEHVVGII